MERKPAKNNTRSSKPNLNANKATWIAVGSLLLGLLTIAAGLFSTNKTLQINSEKDILAIQIASETALNKAIVDIREFLVLEQEECINGRYQGDTKKLRKQFIKLIFALVEPMLIADEIFDLALALKVKLFVNLVYDNKDICSKRFPSESQIIELHREINLDMRKFTNKTRNNIDTLSRNLFGKR